jgi:tetratricopeptide (TPR) repeat protein
VAHLDPADIAALLEATGDAHARLAEIPAALAAYQEARRRAPATDRLLRSRVALNAGLVAERAGSVTRAARWFGIAQRESAAPPGGLAPFDGVAPSEEAHLVELGARVRVERAFLRHTTGHEPEARRLCEQAIDAAGPVGADDVVGRALLLLDMIDLRTAGSSDERRVRRALALFERCDDLPRQAGAWNHLGMTAYFSGEWDTALAHYRNSQQAHIRSGDEWSAAIATANIGEILVDQGRLDDAEPLVVEALRVWRASGTTSDIGFGSALLGRLAARRGRHADALALLSEAATAYSAKDEHVELCDVELRCAEVWLLQANPLAAREHLSRAEAELRTALRLAGHPAADADALPPIPPAVALIRSYGCSAAQLGDRSRAVRLLDAGVALARLTSSTHELALSLAARAWTDGAPAPDEARVMLDQLGVIWTPELPMTASTSPVVVLPAQRQTADQPASL